MSWCNLEPNGIQAAQALLPSRLPGDDGRWQGLHHAAAATAVNVGLPPDSLVRWMNACAKAFVVAAPVVYLLAPPVRRLVVRFVETP